VRSQPYDNPILQEAAGREASVQVVVPARNEEDCIGRCLQSLVGQKGIEFSITVVDDGSNDRTRAIAESFGVRVISAPDPVAGMTGKCNALIRGAQGATAKWLLFTDADTFHYPGSLARAVAEAEERGVDLLSYSPEQETGSLAETALLPLIFADLVRTYPPKRVNDPADPTVAANGQYVLARRAVYEGLGGHGAVADKILEDVELARLFKVSHHPIRFRHGTGLVRARMYRSLPSMIGGWTKNLAMLFHRPLQLAAARGLEFVLIVGLSLAAVFELVHQELFGAFALFIGVLIFAGLFLWRVRQAHFAGLANLVALFGLPLFSWLLVRSWWQVRVRHAVTWKGRIYPQSASYSAAHSEPQRVVDSSIPRSPEVKS
jgi:glycosyltransferase involved in cell wall biosynthesis